MKKTKLFLMLGLFVILMTVFGSVFADENTMPAFKISGVVSDEKVVLLTKNFPENMNYTVSMASSEEPDEFTAVAKFNSQGGGMLNVTVKIPEKFRGLKTIGLMLRDDDGGKILGSFVNIPEEPVEEPVVEQPAEEPAADEPVEEPLEEPAEEEPGIELVNEEPAAEEPVEEPVEEPAAEEPAEEEPAIELVNEGPAAEEPVEEPVEEPAAEEPAVEEPAEEPVAEEPVEEPAAEEPAEEPAEEEPAIELVNEGPAAEEPAEEPAAEAVIEEPAVVEAAVCDFSITPTVTIDAVKQNESVTFSTVNFPANSTFSVSLGYYVSTWTPSRPQEPHHRPEPPRHGPGRQDPPSYYYVEGVELYRLIEEYERPVPGFEPKDKHHHGPAPKPDRGVTTTSFSGTQVSTFNTGDGSPQTITVEIPSSLKGVNPIALWISDLGGCGYYSYNYFYNNSTY